MNLINEGWRAAGLLLHPSSLYSPYGIGDLGPSAHQMVGFLKQAGLHYWQMLPLVPTSPALGNSPYSAYSAFAGNPWLISPDLLVRDGWLKDYEVRGAETPTGGGVDFQQVDLTKNHLFDLAFERAEGGLGHHHDFQQFAWDNGAWLNDYAFFMAAKNYFSGEPWTSWPQALVQRDNRGLEEWGLKLARPILREKFIQYLFFSQLGELKALLNSHGLGIIGDAAIYVNHDSSDVWAQPGLFLLEADGHPKAVAGVPPDYFAPEGQLWGNPLFDWPRHSQEGFNWWKNRLWHGLGLFDWIRLDHFRAFAAYWQVPRGATTAATGVWQPGPGADLFRAASERGPLRLIAEDLGLITPDVTSLRREMGYPGMRVLQFAFGEALPYSVHAPFRIEPDNVVYSATHDNNTSRGWFEEEASPLMQRQLADLSGFAVSPDQAAWALLRLAWLSPGALAVAPLQDMLGLGAQARLNIPGTARGNWGWRLDRPDLLSSALADRLADLGALSGRDNYSHPNTLTY